MRTYIYSSIDLHSRVEHSATEANEALKASRAAHATDDARVAQEEISWAARSAHEAAREVVAIADALANASGERLSECAYLLEQASNYAHEASRHAAYAAQATHIIAM